MCINTVIHLVPEAHVGQIPGQCLQKNPRTVPIEHGLGGILSQAQFEIGMSVAQLRPNICAIKAHHGHRLEVNV